MLNCCHRLNKVTTMVQCDRPAKYGRLKFKINYLELFAMMQSWYCVYNAMVFSEIEVTSEKKVSVHL